MAAVIVNAHSFKRTYDQQRRILEILRRLQIALPELNIRQMYLGYGAWADVQPADRYDLVDLYVEWVVNRPHRISISLIDNDRFFDLLSSGDPIAIRFGVPYVAAAMHIALSVQKNHRAKQKGKGKTILIFDRQDEHEERVCELVANPPEFTDPYYGYAGRGKERLDQIVDTAYYGRSHFSLLVQVGDAIAFITRMHAEFVALGRTEQERGERRRFEDWFDGIAPRLIRRSNLYLCRPSEPICRFYRAIAPSPLPF